jgi:hypothetical protein
LSLSDTLTRPPIQQLRLEKTLVRKTGSGSPQVGSDSNAGDAGGRQVKITTGNTHLKPVLARNIDISIEKYFNDSSYISFNYFVKHYLITIVMLLSLTVNTVIGMTVFQQSEHPVAVADSAHSSKVSHHQGHPHTNDKVAHHDCDEATGCHGDDVCCKTLCDVPCVISPPHIKPVTSDLQNVEVNYHASNPKPSSTVPISPD